jgi:hypothetical protein
MFHAAFIFHTFVLDKHVFVSRVGNFLRRSDSPKTSLHHQGAHTMSVGFLCGDFEL